MADKSETDEEIKAKIYLLSGVISYGLEKNIRMPLSLI